jgi:hypothetical protein
VTTASGDDGGAPDTKASSANAHIDPSHPRSTRIQKWVVLSGLLALFGLGSDAFAVLLTEQELTYSGVFGKGELYMASIGMVFAASGEMLYDRTRLAPAGAWQISLSLGAFILTLFFALGYGFAKAGKSTLQATAQLSLVSLVLAFAVGLVIIILTDLGGQKRD